jgi:hypothetical protein
VFRGPLFFPSLSRPIACFAGRSSLSAGDLCWAGAVLLLTSAAYFARFPHDWAVFWSTNADPRPTWHAGNQGLMALLYAAAGEQTRYYLLARQMAVALVGSALLWLTWHAWRGAAVHRET